MINFHFDKLSHGVSCVSHVCLIIMCWNWMVYRLEETYLLRLF